MSNPVESSSHNCIVCGIYTLADDHMCDLCAEEAEQAARIMYPIDLGLDAQDSTEHWSYEVSERFDPYEGWGDMGDDYPDW